jgi:hypothetical protein
MRMKDIEIGKTYWTKSCKQKGWTVKPYQVTVTAKFAEYLHCTVPRGGATEVVYFPRGLAELVTADCD